MPNAVYLSPHLDDAVFSAGGLMARQVQEEQSVTVLTVFAGDPPPGELSEFAQELHQRWDLGDEPVAARREEDLEACSLVGAGVLHIEIPEAVYRLNAAGVPLYPNEEAIFGPVHPDDQALVEQLTDVFEEVSPTGAQIYCPLAIGGHVDHRLVRLAADRLDRPVWYYQDMPYAAREPDAPQDFKAPDGVETMLPLEDEHLADWVEAVWAYKSQRSTFWDRELDLEYELQDYLEAHSGLPIVAPGRRRRVS